MYTPDVHPPQRPPALGPIGNGYVQEIRTSEGTRFVARWQAYILSPDGNGRKRITCGPHELGPKVHHGPGLRSLADARRAWDQIRWEVFRQHHPPQPAALGFSSKGSPAMPVTDFIKSVWEARRSSGWEESSRGTYEYIRDAFILPFFSDYTISRMNDEDLIRGFMQSVAERNFSDWTARKCYTYVKSILDTARDLGIILGNAARLIPPRQRIPKGVKRSKGQPSISIDQYKQLLDEIKNPRDKIILKILFLCALRRGELFAIKWKDLVVRDGMTILNIERSFDSHTHKIKEWSGKVAGTGATPAKVVVPPKLAEDLEGWRRYGNTNATDPESFIFPTRTGTCIIPTNWAEDVLKPAGERIGLPEITYHWFRRGHATAQHYEGAADKAVQAQLRHADVELTRGVYMQQVGQETYDAVSALEAATLPLEPPRRKRPQPTVLRRARA